jgi:small subunit ribosomal protein S10
LKSPFTDKDAQEHFEVLVHKRLIDIHDPSERTIDSLSNLELPAGVSIEIKM